ncbi:hypothetical protein OS493_039017 [Desmophyllum pertusum]|uniref:Mab-21-like HhH/H2TH-like domain-containing protein n=1 Tax=Desmophyllum pertusum TaxID=174260 RepID=A0A9X0D6G7_9CNID|nr:hypothetical protein OS493_039017 [Desmophyllum pertusum]
MVVLKTSKPRFWGDPEVMVEETGIPGYVRLKATPNSKLRKYVSPEGYIIPERLRNGWFYSLVDQARKQLLQCMDKPDHGCRHELLRIVKTIVNRERTSLYWLNSYHLKTAFMHYIKEKPDNWAGWNSLGEHFVGFLVALQSYLERGNLPHFWLPGVNLLDDIGQGVVGQMAYRLKRILNSEAQRNKILE